MEEYTGERALGSAAKSGHRWGDVGHVSLHSFLGGGGRFKKNSLALESVSGREGRVREIGRGGVSPGWLNRKS